MEENQWHAKKSAHLGAVWMVPQNEPSAEEGSLSKALKEWAIVVKALDEGKQIISLRKGGIAERRNRFALEEREFLLYPTYEHQSEENIKPQFHEYLRRVIASRGGPEKITISNWAGVVDVINTTDIRKVEMLSPHHIWSDAYMEERFNWRSGEPLIALVMRVFRLPKPHLVDYLPEYGGCRSWIGLDQDIPKSGGQPVLDERRFQQERDSVRRVLS